jgi:hypothetical protein
MLKRPAYVCTSPAIYRFSHADDTDGDAYIVQHMYSMVSLFQIGALRIKNLQRTHVETVYSGTDYTLQSC